MRNVISAQRACNTNRFFHRVLLTSELCAVNCASQPFVPNVYRRSGERQFHYSRGPSQSARRCSGKTTQTRLGRKPPWKLCEKRSVHTRAVAVVKAPCATHRAKTCGHCVLRRSSFHVSGVKPRPRLPAILVATHVRSKIGANPPCAGLRRPRCCRT